MALTGAQLLVGFSDFIEDNVSGTSTGAGNAGGTTLADTALGKYGDGRLSGRFLRITSGTNDLEVRRITDNAQSTGTVTVSPAFTAQVATSVTYQIHKYEPSRKFAALDAARVELADDLFIVRYDETITTDGLSRSYAIPSTIRKGPSQVYLEEPIDPGANWNLLSNPRGNVTTSWTNSNFTAALVTSDSFDTLIPKYDETCTRLKVAASTVATYRQTVANMSTNVTATTAAGRRMTVGFWVYSRIASRVDVSILDDSGTLVTSDDHLGRGWELLKVSGTITGNNATTLTVSLNVSSGAAMTIWWNRAYFVLGEDLPECYTNELTKRIRRDDATQRLILPYVPAGKYQLRLIGLDTLAALGTTVATQVTNSMEVDARSAELLYAKAAEILFHWEGLSTESDQKVMTRIQHVMARRAELQTQWKYQVPEQRIEGPYSGGR